MANIFNRSNIETKIASINDEIDKIVADLNRISPKMDELKKVWESDAASNYQKRVANIIEQFEGYKKLINDIPQTAQMAAQEYTKADQASNIG